MDDSNLDQIGKILVLKCNKIMDWSADNKWFDSSLILSLMERLEEGETLTEKQLSAIENIFNKFCKE